MRVAVLAEQNFNLVDGSTVWLLNLCRMLSTLTDVETVLILREPIRSRVLVGDLPAAVRLIEPQTPDQGGRIAPSDAPEAIVAAEGRAGRFDRIIVRGDAFLAALVQDAAFAGRVIAYSPSAMPRLGVPALAWIAEARKRRVPLLTQSPAGKAIFETFHDYPAALVDVLHPVAHLPSRLAHVQERPPLLVYSGKIDPGYGLGWLCDLCDLPLAERGFPISVVAGKTSGGPQAAPVARFEAIAAQPPPDISVHRNLSHGAALAEMANGRFGYCLRSTDHDGTTEISTKVLEFCALGVIPILNDNVVNRDLVGSDYPFLFDVGRPGLAGRVAHRLRQATEEERGIARARMESLATKASPAAGAAILAKVLGAARPNPAAPAPILLRVATHDDKFLARFLDSASRDGRISLVREAWQGIGAFGGSPAQAARGGTILCEWCGENAVWHSHNKPQGARLVVRLHRFEAFRDYPARVDWEAVDHLIVVSEHFKKVMTETQGIPPEKITVLPQYVDCGGLNRKKRPAARFRIGFVGLVPFDHKRFDRAVDFLAAIRTIDSRFAMIVRSAMPWKMRWAWDDRPDDRERYERVFSRIFSDPDLAGAIRFDPPGADMEEWFRDVGFVLSTSDTEGCHTALMEGLASGAMPVVRDWPGARGLFGAFVHSEAEDAIPEVIAHATGDGWEARCKRLSSHAKGWDLEHFDKTMMELIA